MSDIIETSSTQLVFPQGLFQGKEVNLRITEDKKWVSVFDFITLVGGQKNPKEAWNNIKNTYEQDIVQFLDHIKFSGKKQKLTPAVNAKGVVQLLMWIPGDVAKKFRSEAADILQKVDHRIM